MKDGHGIEPVLQQEALCLNNDSSRVGGDGKVTQPPSEDQRLVQWGNCNANKSGIFSNFCHDSV